jgi:RND family efflux transporter MFP subunit
VRQGDLLAELDRREYEARVDQAQAVYDQSARDLERFQGLVNQRAVTEQEFETVRSRKSIAEAALTEAKTFLSYTRVTAPFSGTVIQRQVDVGVLATPGKTLFIMEESGEARFVVTLPEARLGHIEVGDSVTVTITSINATVKGRVDELSPSADPVSRTFAAKIGLPSVAGLRPGQFGRLQLSAGGDETIFIPRKALVRRGQLDLVYVVNAESRAMLRLIRIGRQFPDRLEILAGLRESERVVIEGQRDISDGDLVEAKP